MGAAVVGIDAVPVRVEIDLSFGLPAFQIVGLPDGAVRESRDRVRSALRNSGFDLFQHRITVNLAPADLRKEGAAFDLPVALAMLAAQGVFPPERLGGLVMAGELGLDGRVRPIPGVLPIAVACRNRRLPRLIVPEDNAREAAIVEGVQVIPARTLQEVVGWFGDDGRFPDAVEAPEALTAERPDLDYSEVRGQHHAKRALEVAAAGGHNVLMIGPPGSGKTMLARRLPTILPEPSFTEALETTQIYSAAGLLPAGAGLLTTRPYRSPHHSISDAGLIGGGSNPQPGEVSLSHHGVLFLDELPEFRKHVLELLRQPLEDGVVTISRATSRVTWPASFMLVASMNPCPCGYRDDPAHVCTCTPAQIDRYQARLSGPLLDRIDLHIDVPAIAWDELADAPRGASSAVLRERVAAARERQAHRFRDEAHLHANADMGSRELERYCGLDAAGEELLRAASQRFGFSARAISRILKVARTIADLSGDETIGAPHLAEAVGYRSLDRRMQPI
ncbi:MAG: ATP-binding protein [Candidatus Dadabacteria bacterium]|nr:MAG: ATP-binding protein [Candidatus Dadabacteria bacterium]